MDLPLFYKLIHRAYPVYRYPADRVGRDKPLSFLCRELRRETAEGRHGVTAFHRAAALAVWPVVAVAAAVKLTFVNGRVVRERSGRSAWRQLREQTVLALRDGVFPFYYYMYDIYMEDDLDRVFDYIVRAMVKPHAAHQLLYTENAAFTKSRNLGNKERFHDWCRENGIATPGVHAIIEHGRVRFPDPDSPRLPDGNLFIKPLKGKGGRGAELWRFENRAYVNQEGARLDGDGLLARFVRMHGQNWIVLEHCVCHRDLEDLSLNALNTIRMVTCRNEKGEPEHMVSIFRVARETSKVVDNYHAGGLAVPVDPETGTLGQAGDDGVDARLGRLDDHPVTGGRITGRVMPMWHETVALACRAHEALGPVAFVGWDIGILDSGPTIVEGNASPDIDIEQRVNWPLGNGRYGELLAFHVRAGQAHAQGSGQAG